MENVLTTKDLLSNQDKRYLIILEKLYRGESYTYQELGNNLRVSSNTIREDKKKLINLLSLRKYYLILIKKCIYK